MNFKRCFYSVAPLKQGAKNVQIRYKVYDNNVNRDIRPSVDIHYMCHLYVACQNKLRVFVLSPLYSHHNHEQAVILNGLMLGLAITGKSAFCQPPTVKSSLCLKWKCQWNK